MTRFKAKARMAAWGMVLGTSVLGGALMAASYIGVASTRGSMSVDHASVRGNANLMEGAAVETAETLGHVKLNNGVELTLGEKSKAEIHANRMALLAGAATVNSRGGFGVEALGLRFVPENGAARTRVTVQGPSRLLVAAENGPIRVLSAEGVLMAKLNPGNTYAMEEPQSGPARAGANPPVVKPAAGLSLQAKIWIVVGTLAGVGTTAGVVASNQSDSSR